MKETDSFLMCDDSSHDGHHEAIMDYIISYTLRKTSSKFKETTPILYGYCISIFAKLLEIEGKHDNISFENIIVSKQDCHIDLWVKVDVSKDNKTFHHELIIVLRGFKIIYFATFIAYNAIFRRLFSIFAPKIH